MKRWLCRLRRTVALFLIFTVLFGTLSVGVTADNDRLFVSEVRVCVSSSREEAFSYLKAAGYTVVEQNLNEGTGVDSLYVFLGYKTTKDPERALTDLAILNMNGDYVYTDLSAIDRLCGRSMDEAVRGVQVAAAAMAAKYRAGSRPAIWGFDMLNRLQDATSDRLLGELLFSEPDDETVRRILKDADLTMASLIFSILYVGNGTDDGKPLASALSGFSTKTGRRNSEWLLLAQEMLSDWDLIADPLMLYRNAPAHFGDGQEAVDSYMTRLNEDEVQNYLFGGALEKVASGVLAAGRTQTLADLICQQDLQAEDLCFLVGAMSEGQRAVAAYLTPDILLFAGCDMSDPKKTDKTGSDADTTGSDGSETTKKSAETGTGAETGAETETDGEPEVPENPTAADAPLPVAFGIANRLLSFGALAMTTDAVSYVRENADLRWLYWVPSVLDDRLELTQELASSVYQSIFINTFRNTCQVAFPSRFDSAEDGQGYLMTGLWETRNQSDYTVRCYSAMTGFRMTEVPRLPELPAKVAVAIQVLYNGAKMNVYRENFSQYKRIPAWAVQIRKNSEFTFYDAVEQTILAGSITDPDGNLFAISDLAGDYADLNGWSGNQWNALYATTDPKAGKPILADHLCALADGEQSGLERSYAHAFGETMPYNLNQYAKEDRLGGLYLYFDRWTDYGEKTPTQFSKLDLCLAIGGGSAGGIIIGAVIVYVGYENKKRKLQEQEEKG